MTTQNENEILTRVSGGTPMGDFMRLFWIPAVMSSELKTDGDPVRLVLLGEKLVAFRDTNGKVGIMDHRCPHRCASLFFGRNEEGGIRCVYHGWKFDADGKCLDMANVPAHQDFKHKVHAKAYKTLERNGLIWVFMGNQANVPPLPDIEATMLPEDQVDIRFTQRACNWLQGLEGDIDTSHLDFLHHGKRDVARLDPKNPHRFAVQRPDPEYQIAETEWGAMYGAYRPAADNELYWRIGHFLMPFWTSTPTGPIESHFFARGWVPMDDQHVMVVSVRRKAFDANNKPLRSAGGAGFDRYLPNTTDWYGRWRTEQNESNDYLIDREKQRTVSYTGIDELFMQDQAITESMGTIADRPFEHLAPSDQMITATRRMLLRAAQSYAKDRVTPKAVENPKIFRKARGCFLLAPTQADWQAVYAERLEKVQQGFTYGKAAVN